MTVILALLGAVFGGILGAFSGFFAIIAFGALVGASNDQGGLAMGAALVGAPAGGIVGALAGCLLVLRWRGRRAALNAPATSGGQAPAIRRQGWIALGIVTAGLAALWFVLFYEKPPPLVRSPAPVLHVEIRLPADQFERDPVPQLRTLIETYGGDNLYPNGDVVVRPEGNDRIVAARHRLIYRYPDRRVVLYYARDRVLIADLMLKDIPAPTEGFSDWRPVDHLRAHYYGEDLPPTAREGMALRIWVEAGRY